MNVEGDVDIFSTKNAPPPFLSLSYSFLNLKGLNTKALITPRVIIANLKITGPQGEPLY